MARATDTDTAPLTHAERGAAGMLARLATEEWSEMTAAAVASDNHPADIERWRKLARETNPRINDEQVERLAAMMRRDHYRRLQRLSAQARKLAREAKAELERVGGVA